MARPLSPFETRMQRRLDNRARRAEGRRHYEAAVRDVADAGNRTRARRPLGVLYLPRMAMAAIVRRALNDVGAAESDIEAACAWVGTDEERLDALRMVLESCSSATDRAVFDLCSTCGASAHPPSRRFESVVPYWKCPNGHETYLVSRTMFAVRKLVA